MLQSPKTSWPPRARSWNDPSEKNNLATANAEKVAELQKRIQELAQHSAKSLLLLEQFKVFQKGLHRPPALPNENAYFEGGDEP